MSGMVVLERDLPLANSDMAIRRYHVDLARLERCAVRYDVDRQLRVMLEDIAQVTRPAWVEMLRQHERRGEVRRQAADQDRERLDPASGRPDHDQIARAVLC